MQQQQTHTHDGAHIKSHENAKIINENKINKEIRN